MKILELTNYSAGICGVWMRVQQEAALLAKKSHEVRVFSSNFTKGSSELALSEETIENIKIKRFPARKLGGESFMSWDFEREALAFEPDLIIAHGYRHTHTMKSLKVAQNLRKGGHVCKVFLVTHAPFVEDNSTRSFLAKIAVKIYDKFIGPRTLNKFDKIIAITHWEIPFLEKLGTEKEKIVYIPNGIPEEFFTQKRMEKEEKKLLFLGRISPIKNLEVLIKVMKELQDINIKLEIVGTAEETYEKKLQQLITDLQLKDKISFLPPIYDLKNKIKKIDSCRVFVLPSLREAMPQALIEVMARGKLVVASKNSGSQELVQNNKNGLLFDKNSSSELAEQLRFCFDKKNIQKLNEIRKEAEKSVQQFRWDIIMNELEGIL